MGEERLRTSRPGIAMAALAVVVIIVIVVAGGAAYFVLTSSPSKSTTGTTTTTQVTSATGSTTSTSAITTTATTSSIAQTTTTTTVAPTTTTESTETAFTCTSTSTTTTGAVDYTPQYIGLIKEFSSIQFSINGTEGSSAENETFGYTTSEVQSGIYNVSLTNSLSPGLAFSFIVDTNNNTVISANISGYIVTGASAKMEFDEVMSLFGLEEYYTGEIGVFTDPTYFVNEGTSTQTFGAVSFQVTTWGLKSVGESFDTCGVSATLNSYVLKVGTPPGTSLLFITYLEFSGTSNGTTSDITFQLVSMTLQM
jgi:hypothetical protein